MNTLFIFLLQLLREIKPVSVKYVMDLAEEELPVIRADAKSVSKINSLAPGIFEWNFD